MPASPREAILREMLQRLDVALLPDEVTAMAADSQAPLEPDAYIVVDVLRATTTIAALFGGGLDRLTATATIDGALRLQAEGAILFGEVDGLPPAGFDYGNSPVEAATVDLRGRTGALFTTNGTRALCGVAARAAAYAGAITNGTAVARHVAANHASVVIVCSGTARGMRFTLEDLAGAGTIATALATLAPHVRLGDGAQLAIESVARWPGGAPALVAAAEHAGALRALGLGDDIVAAGIADTSSAVPMVIACGDGWAALEDAAREA